jgi:hypothetical protein
MQEPITDTTSAAVERSMPAGPWLLVVGMHRSGTSAVAGALGSLGFAGPASNDRWEPSENNPDHWESRALGLHDEALLERLGGTWDRPPDPDLDWEADPDLAIKNLGDPAGPASQAFPDPGPVVWKDPRSCLLLPYWLAYLPKPVAAVFIWRSPHSVALSLQARDRMHLADGVALWERYNRSGLTGLIGVDTFVTRYESIVEDPLGRLGALASWLESLPQFADHASSWDLAKAAASISSQLLRQRAPTDTDLLLQEQRRLIEHLEHLEGPQQPLTSCPPGGESPWTTAVLGDRHQLATLSRQRDTLREKRRLQGYEVDALAAEAAALKTEAVGLNARVAALKAELEAKRTDIAGMQELLERMQASTSWRITRPLRRMASLRGRGETTTGD